MSPKSRGQKQHHESGRLGGAQGHSAARQPGQPVVGVRGAIPYRKTAPSRPRDSKKSQELLHDSRARCRVARSFVISRFGRYLAFVTIIFLGFGSFLGSHKYLLLV